MGTAVPLTICALLAGGALVASSARLQALLLALALLVAPAILIVHVRDVSQVQTLRDHPPLAAAAAAGGVALVALLGWLFARVPSAFPLAVAATIPFRVPLSVGGSTANLLLPLYLVVAAGAAAWAAPRLRGTVEEPPARPPALSWALAAALVLYAAQSEFSSDASHALENVVFFYVPFAALYLLLSKLDWTAALAARALAVLSGLAAALAAIGYVEFATRRLFLNPKVIASNQLEDYFRVNSLFFDPNIYGRFLAVVLVVLVAWLLWRPRAGTLAWLATVLAAFLFGGLVLTLSQSSFAALLVGLAVLAALRWDARRTLAVAAAVALAGLAIAALTTSAFDGGSSTNEATSGRADLIRGGGRLFSGAPLAGQGSGSFARDYRRAEHVSAERATSASHTIPVTIAAEQGILGLLSYFALVGLALRMLLRGVRRGPLPAVRAAVAAAWIAVLAHTLMYAAFLEDPLTWALLGVGTALAATATTTSRAPAPEPR